MTTDIEPPATSGVATPSRARWAAQGGLLGVVVAVLLVLGVGLARGEPPENPFTSYRGTIEDPNSPLLRSNAWLYDVRQPSAVPGTAAPWGDRYLTLVVGLERVWAADDGEPEGWSDLAEVDLTVFAVSGDGAREELVLSERGQEADAQRGGLIRTRDPYWIWLTYLPPEDGYEHVEVELLIDAERHTFVLTEVES